MRNVIAIVAVGVIGCIALASPPVRTARAQQPPPAPAPPAPSPAPAPAPPSCATCLQCVGACGTAYADCTRKCFAQPDFASQQACTAQCPTVIACVAACPCAGCSVPGLPH